MSQHDVTARIAYSLFEHRGYAHGRHQDDWFLAERIIEVFGGPVAAPAPTPAKKPRKTSVTAKARALATSADEARALERLADAVARDGRAAVAAQLGYGSSSSVGRLLRGDRALTAEQAARILDGLDRTSRLAA
jgi:hypothetical protein